MYSGANSSILEKVVVRDIGWPECFNGKQFLNAKKITEIDNG